MNEAAKNAAQITSRFNIKPEGKGGDAGALGGKSTPLQYGGAAGTTSEKTSSLSSEYKTAIDSLIKQGEAELAKLKEQLAQSSATAGGNQGTSASSSNSQMSQLQMLLDSITKLIKQSQQSQQSSSGNSSTDAQLSNVMSQLKELLGSLGSQATSGATAGTDATEDTASSGPAMPKDEKDTSVAPSSDTLFKSMDGDNRSADQIINDNPVLKNLGNQKDIKQEDLKKQFGDWTSNNPDEKSRALAAKNMSYFLNNVKALDNREGGDRGDVSTNGKIEGLTKGGDARHGTEAAIVKDVAEQGLDKMFPKDGKLTQTND